LRRVAEFGHFPQKLVAQANPQGWQRVAGGRLGQRGNDHRKGVGWASTPERGARHSHLTAAPLTSDARAVDKVAQIGSLSYFVSGPASGVREH